VRALHPEDRHRVRDFHEIVDREDSFAAEYRVVRPDGRVLWLAGRGQVVSRRPDRRAHRLVSIMADVTEHKRDEAVLRTERERLALALEAGRMGVYELDLQTGTLWWSRHTYALFGVEPETFEPTPASVTALVHPDDREGFVRRRSEALVERHSFLYAFRVFRPDGTLAWLSNKGEAEYGVDGRAVRTFGVVADITEQKRLDAALRAADRRKDEFLATLAHELRNPLAPIRNSLRLFRVVDKSGAAAERAQHIMERQIEQMVRLIDDLMDISRITSGKLELRKEPSTLGAIIGSAVDAARPVLDDLGHRLVLELPADPVFVDADPMRLAQVFTNLLNNAAKYTDPGGRIRLAAERDGD
jgi:PAS domain S-box-containing protein